MSAYRHLQRRTEAEVVELWESCKKRWEVARESKAKLDELAAKVIKAERLRLFASEHDTLAEGARLAEGLGRGQTRTVNTPRLETMVEALRREEQRLESRYRSKLKLPYLPQLPDELDEDTADVVYKQLTTVDASLSWTLGELATERKRHDEVLAQAIPVSVVRGAYHAERHLEAIQKALAVDEVAIVPRPQADRDVKVILAPVVLLAVIVGIMMMAVQLYATPATSEAEAPQSDHASCPSGCDVGKTRP